MIFRNLVIMWFGSVAFLGCFPPALERDTSHTDTAEDTTVDVETDIVTLPKLVFASRLDRTKLDILLVVDNSFSMKDEQAALAKALSPFFERLGVARDGAVGPLPSLHVGVISPNLGAYEDEIPICLGAGDDGALQSSPRADGCKAPTLEPWVKDVVSGELRVTNYDGSIAEAVGCIAQLGVDGCGFEQHLAAIGRALAPDHVHNAGFLRDDAKLAIIIIADEDDCSVKERSIFSNQASNELGPFGSFRCSEFGLVCDGQRLPRQTGAYERCVVRTDSPYLELPKTYARMVRDRKGGDVFIGAIVAPGAGLEVVTDPRIEGGFRVADVCGAADSEAIPGIRFQAFLDEFPGRARRFSICGANFREAMAALGQELAGLANGPLCLGGPIRDTDRCSVYDVTDFERASEKRVEIPRCDGTNTPCFDISTQPTICPATNHHLLLRVDRPRAPAAGAVLVVECAG